jgi:hypothetical protein
VTNTTEGPEFPVLLRRIAVLTKMINRITVLRENAIVRADRTSPYADRRRIGEAAGMSPSRLYKLLGDRGRPRNRGK